MGPDLEEHVAGFAARLRPGGPYRDPGPAERRLATAAMGHLLGTAGAPDAATPALARLGFSHTDEVDAATGRGYSMYADGAAGDRCWGIVLVDRSGPVRLVVEVPHPNSDLRTERMGVRLFRLCPGAVLLVAGAHRKAGAGAADVAHNDRSLFSALAAEAADRRLPQVQLHGYADRSLPGLDAVVSTGTRTATPAAVRVAGRLRQAGLTTCQSWQNSRGRLEGIGNVQAQFAERAGTVFIHLEFNWRIRCEDRLRSAAVHAIAAADIAGTGIAGTGIAGTGIADAVH
jgi:hypothetical protein